MIKVLGYVKECNCTAAKTFMEGVQRFPKTVYYRALKLIMMDFFSLHYCIIIVN
jgi:hypothetical protein